MMRTDRLFILIAIFVFSAGQFLIAADDTTASKKELERIKREMREKKKRSSAPTSANDLF